MKLFFLFNTEMQGFQFMGYGYDHSHAKMLPMFVTQEDAIAFVVRNRIPSIEIRAAEIPSFVEKR